MVKSMTETKMIVVVDGQGGNIGRQLIRSVREAFPDVCIRAVGTNSAASVNMLKGGADEAATGENALITACRQADVIVGPIGIAIADALLGEVSPEMAKAVGQSTAKKVLVPLNRCDIYIPGTDGKSTNDILDEAVKTIRDIL